MSLFPRPAAGDGRGLVAAVCLALLVDMLLYSMVVPVLPHYSRTLGASDFSIELLFAAYAIGLLVASPAAGAFSDRVGRRLPMLLGSFGIASATIVFAFADSYGLLLGARALQGVSAAAVWTAGVALIADVVPADRLGTATGVVMASSSVGLIIGPPLGGLLTEGLGHRAPFLVAAAAAVACGVIQSLVVPASTAGQPQPSPLVQLLVHPPVFVAFAAVVLGAGALSLLEPTLPLDVTARLGRGVAAIGVAFGVATLVHAAMSVVAGYATRVTYPAKAGAGLLVMGVVTPALVLPTSFATVVVLLAMFAAALAFVLVPALAELSHRADALGLGQGGAFALFNSAYAVGMLVGPLAGGGALAVVSTPRLYAVLGLVEATSGLLLLTSWAIMTSRSAAATGPPSPAHQVDNQRGGISADIQTGAAGGRAGAAQPACRPHT